MKKGRNIDIQSSISNKRIAMRNQSRLFIDLTFPTRKLAIKGKIAKTASMKFMDVKRSNSPEFIMLGIIRVNRNKLRIKSGKEIINVAKCNLP